MKKPWCHLPICCVFSWYSKNLRNELSLNVAFQLTMMMMMMKKSVLTSVTYPASFSFLGTMVKLMLQPVSVVIPKLFS